MNVAAALVVSALVAALVAAGAGAGAAPEKRANVAAAGGFRHALAAKLGEQLHKPAAAVLGALKSARATTAHPRRVARLTARADRLTARAHARAAHARRAQRRLARRDAWAAAVAKPLGVSAADVTAALRALVAERLDSLVEDGWLTAGRRDAALACFDDARRCAGIRRPPGLALLRADLVTMHG